MTQIKICGLTRIEDIDAVNRWLPNYIGFVFAKSRRQVTPNMAHYLKGRLDLRIKAVGVFINEPILSIVKLIEDGIIDIVQLHGDENEDYIKKLKQKTTCPIIKAVRVQTTEQILQAEQLSCDMLLLDSYKEGQYGGSGKNFDCSLIPHLQKPFLLAGGLKIENIEQMALKCKPFGVDISSGVETDGKKDENKIRQIIETISNIS
ncbi:MAG: phosphoribosylanthranilate isomerase [Peptostreptococcaceae bacterium]|nr:phosphoribosylanthranilate isomerase [Peptostreptococcaceae bacterium]